jgi:hypothetical protein
MWRFRRRRKEAFLERKSPFEAAAAVWRFGVVYGDNFQNVL